MKTNSQYCVPLVIALLASATCALAQTSGSYNNQTAPPQSMQPGPVQPGAAPQTARPGFLNYIEGPVSADGMALRPGSAGQFVLQPGQSLETANNGYAEVLLTPGAFLRVGPNSEFRMTSAGLADTRIALERGSALLEADQVIAGTHLEVTFGSTSADVVKKGLYGFNTTPSDIRVFDGKLNVITPAKSREVGKSDQVDLANGDGLKKTHFDENQAKLDPLYVWSEARSRDEAAQNNLAARNPNGYVPSGDGWFWDPYAGYYGFWPSAYLYSPFGFGFYGGYYPGFYYGGGYGAGFHRGFLPGRGGVVVHGFNGVHGNGVSGGGFHGGGGGGFHGGGGGGGGHR